MKKIKFSNISTKGNETQNQSSKSKRKILKAFGFGSLAVMMAVAGTFAFAPLGASPSLASASEISNDINTRADGENIKYAPSPLGLDPENDPVIYTTESGLEIKFGGAATALGGGNETTEFVSTLPSSSVLNGYPYFTMGTFNGYAVNWVIIGKSTAGISTGNFTLNSDISYEKLSVWQGKTSESPTYKNFFDQTYETNSPAGSAIKNNNVLNDVSARKLANNIKGSLLASVVPNEEIPSGCVLVISECCLGYSYFNCTGAASTSYPYNYGNYNWGGRYRYISTNTDSNAGGGSFSYSTTAGTLYTYVNNLYSSKLGLTNAQKNLIQGQKLKTLYTNGASPNTYLETSSTDGNTTYNMFPLASFKGDRRYTSSMNAGDENFVITNYLKTTSLRIAYQIGTSTGVPYWTRSSEVGYSGCGGAVGSDHVSDGVIDGYWTRTNYGVRPACVIKFA